MKRKLPRLKPKHMSAADMIEHCDARDLVELVDIATGRGIINRERVAQIIAEQKRVIEMRKDPKHEAWMEQR